MGMGVGEGVAWIRRGEVRKNLVHSVLMTDGNDEWTDVEDARGLLGAGALLKCGPLQEVIIVSHLPSTLQAVKWRKLWL